VREYEEMMETGEGNRNNEGRHILEVCNKWFEKQFNKVKKFQWKMKGHNFHPTAESNTLHALHSPELEHCIYTTQPYSTLLPYLVINTITAVMIIMIISMNHCSSAICGRRLSPFMNIL
jgi:hypothetical protein